MPRIKLLEPIKSAPLLDEAYYSPKDLAKLLSISVSTLRWYRENGRGPKYIKTGHRTVRYPITNVSHYIDEQTRRSTSQQS